MKYTDLMIYRDYPESQRQAALLPKIDVTPNADQLKAALSGAFDCAELPSDTAYSFPSTINGKKAAINANDFFERYIKDYASENPVALEAFYGLLDKHFSMIVIACEMYKHFPDHNDAIAHTVRFVDQNTFTREEASSLIVSTVDALVCEDGLTAQGKKSMREYLSSLTGSVYKLKTTIPKKSIRAINKLTHYLPLVNAQAFAAGIELQSFSKKNQDITTNVKLTYEGEGVNISGRQPVTRFDRLVCDGIASAYIHGSSEGFITSAMVARIINGDDSVDKPSPQQVAAVTRSIDKMRFTRVRIDCKKELEKYNATLDGMPVTGGIIDTYLIKADMVEIQTSGKIVTGFRVNEPPILYSYAQRTKQIITVPSRLLSIKDEKGKVYTSDTFLLVREHLLRRIEGMKGKNSLHNDTISLFSYEKDNKHHCGLYEAAECGISKPSDITGSLKITAQRVREHAIKILEFWKRENYIKDFSLEKDGRAISRIRIQL